MNRAEQVILDSLAKKAGLTEEELRTLKNLIELMGEVLTGQGSAEDFNKLLLGSGGRVRGAWWAYCELISKKAEPI